jgi:hypothetical protein
MKNKVQMKRLSCNSQQARRGGRGATAQRSETQTPGGMPRNRHTVACKGRCRLTLDMAMPG